MKRFAFALARVGILFCVLATARPLAAQTATVSVPEENFRAAPGGSVLAELLAGTPVTLGEARERWREATLEAWIWGRSVQEQAREDLQLIVNAGGENLRASPNGDRLGRARGGMRLERLETRGDWVRVRRTGWIWRPSLEIEPREAGRARSAPTSGDEAPTGTEQGAGTRTFASAAPAAVVLDTPAGDTVARLRDGTTVEVLAREGDWSRIRIEGWTFTGALAGADSVAGGVLEDVSRDSLQANPDAHRGRLIEWTVQFIALQEAERFRTDFLEGEPFILARGPGDDAGFVYLAVPPERRAEVASLSPLQRIRVLGRVRSPRSSLTGAPVLDLLEIVRR
ncbi:MAG: SH3 domain-containing protein [Gemmatimonadota bacterium]